MAKTKKIKSSLIILTRNEIEGMRALIGRIPFEVADEAFVIDYQSTDGTVDFVQKRGIRLVEQVKPGRGEAFKLAAETARGENLVFFSPDGNEEPADISKLLQLIQNGADMAIASRFLPGSRNEEDDKSFKPRLWANKGFTLIANLLWNRSGSYVSDTINGYRAITKTAFQKLKVNATGYAVEYQMSIRAMKLGLKIVEIPTVEGDRIGGESKAKSIPTGIAFLKLLFGEIVS